jgi:hypothetical protein
MTHRSSESGVTARPSAILSRSILDAHITRRRAALAALEANMTAACEAAALGPRSWPGAPVDPAGWDRAAWHRYLAAAMRLEPDFGPRMNRLRQEIGQLERLRTLPIAA